MYLNQSQINVNEKPHSLAKTTFFFFLLRFYLFLEKEREREKHQCGRHTSIICPLSAPQPQIKPHNPGMCPAWELNQQPFALRSDAQPTEPHQSGQHCLFLTKGKGAPQILPP